MNTATLLADVAALGLTTEIANGRRCIYGRLGDVLRVYAAQGLDVRRDPTDRNEHRTASWIVTRGALVGDDVVALVLHDKVTGYTYGRTCLVGGAL